MTLIDSSTGILDVIQYQPSFVVLERCVRIRQLISIGSEPFYPAAYDGRDARHVHFQIKRLTQHYRLRIFHSTDCWVRWGEGRERGGEGRGGEGRGGEGRGGEGEGRGGGAEISEVSISTLSLVAYSKIVHMKVNFSKT